MSVNLLDLLERTASCDASVRIQPAGEEFALSELWEHSGSASRWLSSRLPSGAAVGLLLTTSSATLSALLGAWRAGLTVVSLPMPSRGLSLDEYKTLLDRISEQAALELVLVESRYMDMMEPCVPGKVFPVESVLSGGPRGRDECGTLLQFTSGSTSAPKGVPLTLEKLGHNIVAIIEALDPRAGDSSCSWLPLYHDMGLIGMCLTPWAAAGAYGTSGFTLIDTEAFVRRPGSWLRTMSEERSTHTAAPNFGLELAARFARRQNGLDLRNVRHVLVGAEMVKAATLRAFAETLSPAGLAPTALCPSYGMAEVGLAVSLSGTSAPWVTETLDPTELASGRWVKSQTGVELVSSGKPIGDMEVVVSPEEDVAVGPLRIRGSSVFDGYLGQGHLPADGWFDSGDLGAVRDGTVWVVGRHDEVLVVRGQNVHSPDLEAVAESVSGKAVRPGTATATLAENGSYVIVAERGKTAKQEDLPAVAATVRHALAQRVGVAPSAVLFLTPGTFPMTASGKKQRHRVQADLYGDRLSVDHVTVFGGTS